MLDGNKIASWMKEATNKANDFSRHIIFAIIAVTWTISFTEEGFSANVYAKWSLILSIIYIIFKLIYMILAPLFYRYILKKYFVSHKDIGYEYKENGCNIKAHKATKSWQFFGVLWFLILETLLIAAGVLLIFAIINTPQGKHDIFEDLKIFSCMSFDSFNELALPIINSFFTICCLIFIGLLWHKIKNIESKSQESITKITTETESKIKEIETKIEEERKKFQTLINEKTSELEKLIEKYQKELSENAQSNKTLMNSLIEAVREQNSSNKENK